MKRRTITLLSLALALLATGCTTWRTQPGSPEEILGGENREFRILLADGTSETLVDFRIQNDSVVGTSNLRSSPDSDISATGSHPVAVALSDITEVQAKGLSFARTAVAVAAGVTLIAVIGAIAPDDPPPSRTPETFSCPLVYSWNGTEWVLDSGTFGGAIMRPLARVDVDNLDHLWEGPDGALRLRVANELAETDHLDALTILAVDHPPGTSVSPDPAGGLHLLGSLASPSAARDFDGLDALERVQFRDGWAWESPLRVRDAESSATRDGIVLRFQRPERSTRALLVLDAHNTAWASHLLGEYVELHGEATDAWYASLEANPESARRLGEHFAREAFLRVSVLLDGAWTPQGMAWEAGPEILKRQVIPLDLSGIEGDEVEIRLDAPASFWRIDHAGIAWPQAESDALAVTELHATSAIGADGSDLRPILAEMDGREVTMETGETFEVGFRAPPRAEGMERTYLLNAGGWYQIHTDGSGAQDSELLERIETEPGAIARVAAEWMNEALISLEGSARSQP